MTDQRVAYYLVPNAYTESMGTGGLERHMMVLAEGVRQHGFSTYGVLSPSSWLDPIAAQMVSNGAQVVRIEPLRPTKPGKLLVNGLRLTQFLRSARISVFHIQSAYPWHGKWALLLARAARVPVILTTDHDTPPHEHEINGRNRQFDKLLDAIVVVSEYNRRLHLDTLLRPQDSVHRIYNGIAIPPLEGSHEDRQAAARAALKIPMDVPVIGTVARLTARKGVGDLIEVASRLSADWPTLQVVISGEGPERAAFEARIAELGLGSRVRFLGFHPSVSEVIRALDVFVLPTYWEAFGLVAAEAMAEQKPVVATTVGGLPEVVRHGTTGMLAEPGDIAALTTAVDGYLRDPGRCRRAGEEGRRRVETLFSVDSMVQSTVALYNALLHERAVPAYRSAGKHQRLGRKGES